MKKILCCVEWEDACNHSNTSLEDVLGDISTVRTYGILEYKDKNYHIVLMHDGAGDGNCDRMKIPSPLIRKITKLKEVPNQA